MKGKEAAGNVLMGTIGGEGSLSQIPILVLQVFYPIIKVCYNNVQWNLFQL
jgi:hypothetical protein